MSFDKNIKSSLEVVQIDEKAISVWNKKINKPYNI